MRLIVGCIMFSGDYITYFLSENKFVTILKLQRNEGEMGKCAATLSTTEKGWIDG